MANIVEALKYLPEHHINRHMVWEGLKTGNIELLNYLPEKFLKPQLANMLFRYDKSKSNSFNLNRIPESVRTQNICDKAVEGDEDNYKYVPEKFRTTKMLRKVMPAIRDNFEFLPLIPPDTWDIKAVYDAIESLNKERYSSYGYSSNSYYSQEKIQDVRKSHSKTDKIMLMQIMLTYVPQHIKNKVFYHGLFDNTSLKVPDIDLLTPTKHKNKRYYSLMAANAFQYVPVNKIDYNGLYTAIESGSLPWYAIFRDDSDYRNRIFEVMDDKMADLIAQKHPDYFEQLPEKFLTSGRLSLCIETNPNHRDFYQLVDDLSSIKDKKEKALTKKIQDLMTTDICKTLVSRNMKLPEFPKVVWNQEFVDYCMEHGTKHYWFGQMPKEFQTQEMVNTVLEADPDKVKFVHRSFLNSYMAMRLYRKDTSLKQYLPKEFFKQFRDNTGLDDRFFGGEKDYFHLRDIRASNTYFQIGNSFFGIYNENNAFKFIMTKPPANGKAPKMVFDIIIKAFRPTWLEKAILDNDPDYYMPDVTKDLRHLQYSKHYSVEKDIEKDGVQVYKNLFRGQTIGYVALREDEDGEHELIFEVKRDDLFQYFE